MGFPLILDIFFRLLSQAQIHMGVELADQPDPLQTSKGRMMNLSSSVASGAFPRVPILTDRLSGGAAVDIILRLVYSEHRGQQGTVGDGIQDRPMYECL